MKPTTTGDSMTGSVLDILIYVFDQYMLAEAPEVPEREALAADLERAGFGRHNVERALDWLADLAGERSRLLQRALLCGHPRYRPAAWLGVKRKLPNG